MEDGESLGKACRSDRLANGLAPSRLMKVSGLDSSTLFPPGVPSAPAALELPPQGKTVSAAIRSTAYQPMFPVARVFRAGLPVRPKLHGPRPECLPLSPVDCSRPRFSEGRGACQGATKHPEDMP